MARATLTPPQALERAVAAYRAGKFLDAEKMCQHIIAARNNFFDALHLLAVVQASQNKNEEAVASYGRALIVRPDDALALVNCGNALQALKRYDEALASYDRALSVRPDYAEALNNRGVTLYELKRFAEALESYDRALMLRPELAEALYNRGNALRELRRYEDALISYDRALSIRPDHAETLNNRGNALQELKLVAEAQASYERAVRAQPNFAEAHYNRGTALQELKRHEEALASYESALLADPDHPHALGGTADCALKLCDWDKRAQYAADLVSAVSGKKSVVSPFVMLGYSGDPWAQLHCARNYMANIIPSPPRPMWTGEIWRHDKLRVAYLSARFGATATAHLIAELIERHDRSRFEIVGISFGAEDRSEMRQRLIGAFDAFHDVRGMSDRDVARLLYDLRVDVAVDLMGHMRDSRTGILSFRPAPIQASYLGYPGTIGAQFMDYIIADSVVAPFELQSSYVERIVHLPECYQANDTRRKIADKRPTKAEAGLPERGFVFCCFNNSWKITPEMFDVWMRLLQRVEGSVLWLLRDSEGAERNLRKEAQRRGIDPSRLVLAARLPPEEHLARHRLADLFLDTLPYNAHTTASDALWTGLPVLTCKGGSFAGRVAASLLQAIGLPELITSNLAEYEALALELARDPALLAKTKTTLARHRDSHPLFDTPRFARHIEAAYRTMWEIWQRGEAPRSFSVEPSGKAR